MITSGERSAALGVMVVVNHRRGPDQSASGRDLAMTLLGNDHLDLLLSAALEWAIPLPPSPRVALSRLHPPAVLASATGVMLRQHNAAADGQHEAPEYTFTPVLDLDPVFIVKAVRAMVYRCQADPRWHGGAGQQFLRDLDDAAVARIDRPWEWHRPAPRFGAVAGIAAGWKPEIPGLQWLSPADAGRVWRSARHLLVTPEALEILDPQLVPRELVLLIGSQAPSPTAWRVMEQISCGQRVAFWPVARAWLVDLLPELDWASTSEVTS